MSGPFDNVGALDTVIHAKSQKRSKTILDQRSKTAAAGFRDAEDYFAQRGEILSREATIGFDYRCTVLASDLEVAANKIVQDIKARDKQAVYDAAEPRRGCGGQLHPRFPGDHFLSNRELIGETCLFDVARRMPKGAHLHIHFNACLLPHVLLDIAKDMDRMFITSDLPLVADNDYINFSRCEIQFSILPPEKEKPGDVFTAEYEARQTTKFSDFRREFPSKFAKMTVDEWLVEKLVFQEDETYGILQTASGAWEKFNGRTRMMKGLFNYETAYRKYTRLLLQDFVNDNIQYAEIRPNFMKTNQLFTDDGANLIDNDGIMRIIIDEYEAFQQKSKSYFGGLKIIYCAPRSFSNDLVKYALDECLRFKRQWPKWIAGK